MSKIGKLKEVESVQKMNVFQKIHAVQQEIGMVAKNGRNSFQNYDYATEADFVQAVRPLLNKWGLVIIPQEAAVTSCLATEKGDKKDGGHLTSVGIRYQIVNIEDPKDYATITMVGQGSDKGDKGAYKAITGAKKYMLANTFMIATGDDPEKDGFKAKPKKAATLDDF